MGLPTTLNINNKSWNTDLYIPRCFRVLLGVKSCKQTDQILSHTTWVLPLTQGYNFCLSFFVCTFYSRLQFPFTFLHNYSEILSYLTSLLCLCMSFLRHSILQIIRTLRWVLWIPVSAMRHHRQQSWCWRTLLEQISVYKPHISGY